MALRMSPVPRNLHAKITLLSLELEDMLFLAAASAGAMLLGQFFFSDWYMFFLPTGWFLLLMVPAAITCPMRRFYVQVKRTPS
jgi:hypothetical protein